MINISTNRLNIHSFIEYTLLIVNKIKIKKNSYCYIKIFRIKVKKFIKIYSIKLKKFIKIKIKLTVNFYDKHQYK